MKRIISVFTVVFLLLSCLSLAGCGDSNKIVLKVYNWGGDYISTGEGDTLDTIAEFEKAYPHIKVEYTTFASNEEMYAKLQSGSAQYDVIIPSDYMIARMIEEDMVEQLDFSNIPNYADVMDQYKNLPFDPNNIYSVPYIWGTVGIIYDSSVVKDVPTSWDVLWDPQYADQVLMFDNPRDALGIAMKKLGYSQNSTNAYEWQEAAEELKKQKWQAYLMDEILDKMENGEAVLAPYYAGDTLLIQEENPNIAFAMPEEGSNLFVDSMVVQKGSAHKTEAEQFINFMCETRIAKANVEMISYSTPLQSVYDELEPEWKNSKILYPDREVLDRCESFVHLPADINALIQSLWLEIKAG